MVLLIASLLPFLASLLYFVLLSGTSFATLVYSGTKVFTLVWPLVFRSRIQKPFPEAFGVDKKDLLFGICSGGLIVAAIVAILGSPLREQLGGHAGSIKAKVESFGIQNYYLAFTIFLSVFHSAIEEFYWRWFVFGLMRQYFSPLAAHLLAAAAFTSHHVIILSQYFPVLWTLLLSFAVLLGGLIWSYSYQKSGSLLGAWISHMLVDFGIMWAGYQLLFS